MIYYLNGKILSCKKDRIIVLVHDKAYEIIVSNVTDFEIGKEYIIYTHLVYKPEEIYLIGFLSEQLKDVFISLINVKGIGPRSALSILKNVRTNELLTAIKKNDIGFLKKIKGVGNKAACQILIDFKGEFHDVDSTDIVYQETSEALKQLGFHQKAIDDVMKTINTKGLKSEDCLKEALIKLRKKKHG